MKFKKNIIATAIAATSICAPVTSSADIINFDFTGVLTLVGGSGNINFNSDAAGSVDGQGNTYILGGRTPFSGIGEFDTITGVGSINIDYFSFFGNGMAQTTSFSIQAIGDGMGGFGSLVAGAMGFNWTGGLSIPITAIFDASGFFDSFGAPGTSWTTQTGCTACANSATPTTVNGVDFVPSVGAVPIAMTTFNTFGATLDTLFPLSTDGVAGSPMTTAPFPGQNMTFDFTTINATNVPQVPVPAAAWLFGSGLLGLVAVARRRRQC